MTQSYAQRSAELFDRRPGILTLTAGLMAAYGVGSMMASVSGAPDQAMIRAAIDSQPGFVAWLLRHYGSQGFTAFGTFQGLLLLVTAVGVWMMKPWGRRLLYLVSFLGVAMQLQSGIFQWIYFHRFPVFAPLFVFLFGWPLWYLGRPHVKEAFGPPAATKAASETKL